MDNKLFMYIFDTNDLTKPESIFHVYAKDEVSAIVQVLKQSNMTMEFFKEFIFDDFNLFNVLSKLYGSSHSDEEIAAMIRELSKNIDGFYPFYEKYIESLPLEIAYQDKLKEYIPFLVEYAAHFQEQGTIKREDLLEYDIPIELLAIDAIYDIKKNQNDVLFCEVNIMNNLA